MYNEKKSEKKGGRAKKEESKVATPVNADGTLRANRNPMDTL